jgi:hypothetical protein
MGYVRSYEQPPDVSPEREAPATAAYTDDSPDELAPDVRRWALAVGWLVITLVAIALLAALYALFGPR